MLIDNNKYNKIIEALYKKAIGYQETEITKEYVIEDKKAIECKKKERVINYAPDTTACIKLLEIQEKEQTQQSNLDNLSENELKTQALKLVKKIEAVYNN